MGCLQLMKAGREVTALLLRRLQALFAGGRRRPDSRGAYATHPAGVLQLHHCQPGRLGEYEPGCVPGAVDSRVPPPAVVVLRFGDRPEELVRSVERMSVGVDSLT